MSGLHSQQDGIFSVLGHDAAKEFAALRSEIAQLRGMITALYEQRLVDNTSALEGENSSSQPDTDFANYERLSRRLESCFNGHASPRALLAFIEQSGLWVSRDGEPMRLVTERTLTDSAKGRLTKDSEGNPRPYLARNKVNILHDALDKLGVGDD